MDPVTRLCDTTPQLCPCGWGGGVHTSFSVHPKAGRRADWPWWQRRQWPLGGTVGQSWPSHTALASAAGAAGGPWLRVTGTRTGAQPAGLHTALTRAAGQGQVPHLPHTGSQALLRGSCPSAGGAGGWQPESLGPARYGPGALLSTESARTVPAVPAYSKAQRSDLGLQRRSWELGAWADGLDPSPPGALGRCLPWPLPSPGWASWAGLGSVHRRWAGYGSSGPTMCCCL